MKIKTKEMPYEDVLALPTPSYRRPKKPNLFFRTVLKVASLPDLLATRFTYKAIGMERLGKKEPCLILMNHSSFVDLEIAASVLFPRPFQIVCTSDGMIGKGWLMRNIGCIPTNKFVTDTRLIQDMRYALKTLNSSVLMYPEASYSFDGTATPLPESLGKCLKLLKVPVVMIRTYGAFTRDPLYNNLQRRKVKVSANVEYLLSPEEIQAKTPEELNEILKEQFSFDNFRWQQENKIRVKEKFRADFLNRVLYKCPHCMTEGQMVGKGTKIACGNCGAEYELTEFGYLKRSGTDAKLSCETDREDKQYHGTDDEAKLSHGPDGVAKLSRVPDEETKFTHVPDWYQWERECVRGELLDGTYALDIPVDIYVLVNHKCIYKVGSGNLKHGLEGFRLTGCDGKIDYRQPPLASYSLYSDYYWYEIGDMICIGNQKILYYCFPKNGGDVVAKTRLATEELYKIEKAKVHK